MLLSADTFHEELSYAVTYIREYTDPGKKVCLAFAGLTAQDVKKIRSSLPSDVFGKRNVGVLDTSANIGGASVFLSDLESTKGYEFDSVIILNCNLGVLPNKDLPQEESFRDITRFYIAMTRAKIELILSYSGKIASVLKDDDSQYFIKAKWTDQVEPSKDIQYPTCCITSQQAASMPEEIIFLTGKKFLYTHYAIGASVQLQDQMMKYITGTELFRNVGRIRQRCEWRNIAFVAITILSTLGHFVSMLLAGPHYSGRFPFNLFPDIPEEYFTTESQRHGALRIQRCGVYALPKRQPYSPHNFDLEISGGCSSSVVSIKGNVAGAVSRAMTGFRSGDFFFASLGVSVPLA